MKKNITNENTSGQNSVSKKKKIVTTMVAGVLSVALLGTATYAWFVLNNRPTVDALTMSAGTSGSLQVALKPSSGTPQDSDYKNKITIGDASDSFCLRPLTSPDGDKFYQPVYDEQGNVKSINSTAMKITENGQDTAAVNNSEENGGWLIKKQFYIRNKVSDNTDTSTKVSFLAPSDSSDGTKFADTATGGNASKAVRASFKLEYSGNQTGCTPSGTTVILEPNAGINDLANAVKFNGAYYNNINYIAQQRTDNNGSSSYKFKDAYGQMAASDTFNKVYSPTLFTIPNNIDVLVTMYVWLEGTDTDCTNVTNSIEANAITATLQFVATDDMENN